MRMLQKIISFYRENLNDSMSEEDKNDFYKKAFWICFVYVLWDTARGFGVV